MHRLGCRQLWTCGERIHDIVRYECSVRAMCVCIWIVALHVCAFVISKHSFEICWSHMWYSVCPNSCPLSQTWYGLPFACVCEFKCDSCVYCVFIYYTILQSAFDVCSQLRPRWNDGQTGCGDFASSTANGPHIGSSVRRLSVCLVTTRKMIVTGRPEHPPPYWHRLHMGDVMCKNGNHMYNTFVIILSPCTV